MGVVPFFCSLFAALLCFFLLLVLFALQTVGCFVCVLFPLFSSLLCLLFFFLHIFLGLGSTYFWPLDKESWKFDFWGLSGWQSSKTRHGPLP